MYPKWRDLTILLMMAQSERFPFGMYKSGKDQVFELIKLLSIFNSNGLASKLIPMLRVDIHNKYRNIYPNIVLRG